MEERSTGLILRTRPLTETSLIVQWLTRDFGRISTVAKGARRPKSAFLGKLDLFYLADFSFHASQRSELHTLREVRVREFHQALRGDLASLQQASYFTQLLEQTTETNTPLPGLFELLAGALSVLCQSTPGPVSVYAFEMKLLVELGLQPEFTRTSITPGACEILDRLASEDWAMISLIRVSSKQAGELSRFLEAFLLFHFGKVPKARSAALRIEPERVVPSH